MLEGCPNDLEYIFEAHKMRLKEQDEISWRSGFYMTSAVYVAVSKAMYGRKSTAEYCKEPILKNWEMSEKQKEEYRDMFWESLKTMQANFEINKKGR